ncbi:preprotein translocase subunit SecG [Truepera radiovictrix]|uniref:Protein-export membrane protein SecG n=1 Tax=Truepera radiovictrix (strain DSM 17093 / CIP 108686 / LMG 22925 / RQ-24) TaxID=649638 RepID=D7CSH6_TRURR|nr:preprotein translocase subunit SecG [Truepera radiovictrix]ADI15396.1 preprotein translocase, SecG subunit [Truepera radiovictrix DSM 17093]WMT56053.1 preprotein translocase subunit SecG [Truepera radiovictrix]
MYILFWVVFVLFVVLSLALTAVILLQEPRQGGLGEGLGGGAQDFAGTRGGTAGGLQRLTIYMGVVWGLLALALAVLPRA